MGFLKRFSEDKPDIFSQLKNFNDLSAFSIVGGGITSPDNLLPHGEAFIRNYLSGMRFLRNESVKWSETVWLPDDFGHDSQLPILLEELGIKAVGFARLPSLCKQVSGLYPESYIPAYQMLIDPVHGGNNFYWESNDGSRVVAYFMPQGYGCGDDMPNTSPTCRPNTPTDAASCTCSVTTSDPLSTIQTWYNVRAPISPSPYVFVATGSDFRLPLTDLPVETQRWNQNIYPKTGIYAVASQFDVYFNLMMDWLAANNKTSGLKVRNFHGTNRENTFQPTPYWTGFYSSRPALKQGHYNATRLLQANEVLALLSKVMGAKGISQSSIDDIWDQLAPSTHHDFITGTATDYVYQGEQLPLLREVQANATMMKNDLLSNIISALKSNGVFSGPSIFAFNQNGFDMNDQFVEFSVDSEFEKKSLLSNGNIQALENGNFGAVVSVPSLGYTIASISSLPLVSTDEAAKISMTLDGDQVTLDNPYLGAVLSVKQGWTIVSLIDKKASGGPKSILQSGNVLSWRQDLGNIYRYGYEMGCGFDLYDAKVVSGKPQIVERGPLRIVARAVVTMSATYPAPLSSQNYTIEYTLVHNEPFLRINVTGAAAGTSAVITTFTFKNPIPKYTHGTTYHWDWKQPLAYGVQKDFPVTMEATHDFIGVMDASNNYQGAIYHSASPSWGVEGNNLHGVILRNSPGRTKGCPGYGADGTDTESHSILYAIRVPSSFSQLTARQEALAYHTPLTGVYVNSKRQSSSSAALPKTLSLASVSSTPNNVIISALKAGTYDEQSTIVRLYNPSNTPSLVSLKVSPSLNPSQAPPTQVTALEIPAGEAASIKTTNAIRVSKALVTLQFS